MEWANYVAEKKWRNLFSAEIRVVGSYTDRLLRVLERYFTDPVPSRLKLRGSGKQSWRLFNCSCILAVNFHLEFDTYCHMNSCTEYLFCKLHLNTKKTQILFGIIAGSFFSFVLSKSKYKLLTALYLTNTDKSWLCSALLQQTARSMFPF